jgi:uncharacterized protein (UPF0332 family)
MLGLHFVSKGLIPIEIGRILTTLFERRQTGDYDDFVLCDQSEVVELREKAVAYIDCMKSMARTCHACTSTSAILLDQT